MSQKHIFTAIIQHADEGCGAYVEIPFDLEATGKVGKDRIEATRRFLE